MLRSFIHDKEYYNYKTRPERRLNSANDRKEINRINKRKKEQREAEKQFEIKPEFQKYLERTRQINEEMNMILCRNKNSTGNQFLIKSKNITNNMDYLNKRINNTKEQIKKHDVCFVVSLKNQIILNEEHKMKVSQNRYLGDETGVEKSWVKDINNEISKYKQSKVKTDLLIHQLNEQTKLINKDIKLYQDKIKQIKNENLQLQQLLIKYRRGIYAFTKQNDIKEIIMRNIQRMTKTK